MPPKKFAPPSHPLELEAGIPDLRPPEKLRIQQRNRYLRTAYQASTELPVRAAIATHIVSDLVQGVEGTIDTDWRDDFRAWLMGNSAYNLPMCQTPWGGQNLLFVPGVKEFLNAELDKHWEFRKALLELQRNGPGDNVNQAYLYYKYIVRAYDWIKRAMANKNQPVTPPWFDPKGMIDFLDQYKMSTGPHTEDDDDDEKPDLGRDPTADLNTSHKNLRRPLWYDHRRLDHVVLNGLDELADAGPGNADDGTGASSEERWASRRDQIEETLVAFDQMVLEEDKRRRKKFTGRGFPHPDYMSSSSDDEDDSPPPVPPRGEETKPIPPPRKKEKRTKRTKKRPRIQQEIHEGELFTYEVDVRDKKTTKGKLLSIEKAPPAPPGNPPPPPPPPPPPSGEKVPRPPPPSGEGNKAKPSSTPTTDDIMREMQGKKLKDASSRTLAPKTEDPRDTLLSQIQKGTTLKKTSQVERPPPPPEAESPVYQAFTSALGQRAAVMRPPDDSDEEGDDDWEEEPTFSDAEVQKRLDRLKFIAGAMNTLDMQYRYGQTAADIRSRREHLQKDFEAAEAAFKMTGDTRPTTGLRQATIRSANDRIWMLEDIIQNNTGLTDDEIALMNEYRETSAVLESPKYNKYFHPEERAAHRQRQLSILTALVNRDTSHDALLAEDRTRELRLAHDIRSRLVRNEDELEAAVVQLRVIDMQVNERQQRWDEFNQQHGNTPDDELSAYDFSTKTELRQELNGAKELQTEFAQNLVLLEARANTQATRANRLMADQQRQVEANQAELNRLSGLLAQTALKPSPPPPPTGEDTVAVGGVVVDAAAAATTTTTTTTTTASLRREFDERRARKLQKEAQRGQREAAEAAAEVQGSLAAQATSGKLSSAARQQNIEAQRRVQEAAEQVQSIDTSKTATTEQDISAQASIASPVEAAAQAVRPTPGNNQGIDPVIFKAHATEMEFWKEIAQRDAPFRDMVTLTASLDADTLQRISNQTEMQINTELVQQLKSSIGLLQQTITQNPNQPLPEKFQGFYDQLVNTETSIKAGEATTWNAMLQSLQGNQNIATFKPVQLTRIGNLERTLRAAALDMVSGDEIDAKVTEFIDGARNLEQEQGMTPSVRRARANEVSKQADTAANLLFNYLYAGGNPAEGVDILFAWIQKNETAKNMFEAAIQRGARQSEVLPTLFSPPPPPTIDMAPLVQAPVGPNRASGEGYQGLGVNRATNGVGDGEYTHDQDKFPLFQIEGPGIFKITGSPIPFRYDARFLEDVLDQTGRFTNDTSTEANNTRIALAVYMALLQHTSDDAIVIKNGDVIAANSAMFTPAFTQRLYKLLARFSTPTSPEFNEETTRRLKQELVTYYQNTDGPSAQASIQAAREISRLLRIGDPENQKVVQQVYYPVPGAIGSPLGLNPAIRESNKQAYSTFNEDDLRSIFAPGGVQSIASPDTETTATARTLPPKNELLSAVAAEIGKGTARTRLRKRT